MSAPGQAQSRIVTPSKLLDPWTPDIDARRNDKPCIISGNNFRDMLDGPCSYWGNDFVNYNYFDPSTRLKVNELRITNGFLYGTPKGVFKINPTSKMMEPLLIAPNITVTNTYWPWTIAYVGGKYYLAQYDIGLWQYDDVNETLSQITTPLGNTVRGVAADHGRLIAISDSVVANSALDDGTDFTPSLSTGAGAQSVAIVGGTPYKIETVTDGFLVFLSKGIMKGNWSTAAYVYTHTKHSESVRVFTPNSTITVPGLGVLAIDNNGMWLTKEYNYETYGYPQLWDVEKSDYFKRFILAYMDQNLYGTIFLYFSKSLQVLFICFSGNLTPGFFQTTFCWDMVSKRWSSFDEQHYGIFETYDQTNNQYTCSYIDVYGYMHAFQDQNFSEDYPASPLQLADFIYRPLASDPPTRRIIDADLNGGVFYELCGTEILQSDNNAFGYANYTTSGVYSLNNETFSDTVSTGGDPTADVSGSPIIVYTNIDLFVSGIIELYAIPYIAPSKALNSNIVIGPWRFNSQNFVGEETSAVEGLMLSINNTNGFQVYEDWNADLPAEDYNALSGAEDWSAGSAYPNIYEVELTSSQDAFSTPLQGAETLDAFIDASATKIYKPNGWNGIYHTIKISADQVSDCFSIKAIDLTANLTGAYQSDQGA